MLLRSSSAPVLSSLLSSVSDSPNHHQHPPSTAVHHTQFSFPHSGSLNCTQVFSNASPVASPSVSELSDAGRTSHFRRAQSEGNFQGLMGNGVACNHDEFSFSNPVKRFSRRPNSSMLETIPSFSLHGARRGLHEDEYTNEEEEEEEEEEVEQRQNVEDNGGSFESSGKGEENSISMAVESSDWNLERQNMNLNDEIEFLNRYRSLGLEQNQDYSPEMYLARGPGVDRVNIGFGGWGGHDGGGGGCSFGRDAGDNNVPGVEEHYKRLMEQNPGNALFLRNYAQFLYQTKQDLAKAEEYYSRAVLADPGDGEVLSLYARLVWELHHDQDRASSYFERAVHAAPQDSHVCAAYASFLWETEEDDEAP
ncbi:uncharacterized protein LOC127796345 [Diospyros lotus]|uniref:uncharacterized protein LOC127796345 n=1 Tax=Diospyros lotus TaxID=55363 RepID=UPI00225677B5|nr:uncharacterized protein LOC127796345 [Diospyros lotus]